MLEPTFKILLTNPGQLSNRVVVECKPDRRRLGSGASNDCHSCVSAKTYAGCLFNKIAHSGRLKDCVVLDALFFLHAQR